MAVFQRQAQRDIHQLRTQVGTLEHRVRQLEQERGGLQRILDSLDESVIAVDRTGIVVHVNSAAAALFNFVPDRVCGNHMASVIPDQRVCDALEHVMRPGAGDTARSHDEISIETAVGEVRHLSVDVTPLREAEGNEDPDSAHLNASHTEGAIAVLQDVTAIRRLERARTDFFTNVSHELKTPITAIRGAVETMLDSPDMAAEDTGRFLATLRRQSERLAALVRDLLSLARIESEQGRTEYVPVDLGGVVTAAVGVTADAARAQDIAVSIHQPSDRIEVLADREAMIDAVENLLANAIRYSDSGGAVAVEVGTHGEAAFICVTDNGEGIAPEHQERIFERFYRVDPARSRERGGTGIGLSIVKHVALAHGGNIDVSSTPGAGSTFRLQVPLASAVAHSDQ